MLKVPMQAIEFNLNWKAKQQEAQMLREGYHVQGEEMQMSAAELRLPSGAQPEPELGPWAEWSVAAQLALRGGKLGRLQPAQLALGPAQLARHVRHPTP